MASCCRAIGWFSSTIFIWITRNTINIFWSNISNNLTLLYKITNFNNKIRGSMTISNFEIIKRKSDGITACSKERTEGNFTIIYSNKFCTFGCRDICTMMKTRSTASRRLPWPKRRTYNCISWQWP